MDQQSQVGISFTNEMLTLHFFTYSASKLTWVCIIPGYIGLKCYRSGVFEHKLGDAVVETCRSALEREAQV